MTGPVNVQTISTLIVKSGRPGKCEKNSTLNVKKKFDQLHDQSDGQFGHFGRHFRVSGCQRSKSQIFWEVS